MKEEIGATIKVVDAEGKKYINKLIKMTGRDGMENYKLSLYEVSGNSGGLEPGFHTKEEKPIHIDINRIETEKIKQSDEQLPTPPNTITIHIEKLPLNEPFSIPKTFHCGRTAVTGGFDITGNPTIDIIHKGDHTEVIKRTPQGKGSFFINTEYNYLPSQKDKVKEKDNRLQ